VTGSTKGQKPNPYSSLRRKEAVFFFFTSCRQAAPEPELNNAIFRINPLTSVLLTAALGLGAIGSAQAATFFVRTDGGDANQCNGKADAAYSGSGTAQNCAWKHPYYALPSSGTPRIAGGDTLMIGSGEYMIAYGAPGATGSCTSSDRSACNLGSIPSGTATAKTRILGNSAAPPKLWGTERN
jgi:hypothetical protein